METTSVMKTKFLQIIDTFNSILSLPHGQPSLTEINDFKTEKGQKMEKYFWEEKEKLLDMEKKTLQNTPRLWIFDQILNQEPKIVNLNKKSDFAFLYPTTVKKAIKDIVLSGDWMK